MLTVDHCNCCIFACVDVSIISFTNALAGGGGGGASSGEMSKGLDCLRYATVDKPGFSVS